MSSAEELERGAGKTPRGECNQRARTVSIVSLKVGHKINGMSEASFSLLCSKNPSAPAEETNRRFLFKEG